MDVDGAGVDKRTTNSDADGRDNLNAKDLEDGKCLQSIN